MIEITWDNFIPVVMNDRKMVKMIYKEDFSYSPITMIYLNDKGKNYYIAFLLSFHLLMENSFQSYSRVLLYAKHYSYW